MNTCPTTLPVQTSPVFLLTIDTEEEWDWSGSFPSHPFSTKNIEQIPDFQTFCRSLDIRPTYFVDYAVVDNLENAEIFKHFTEQRECDVGAHLHPWCTPPIDEDINERNSHAVNLELALFERKMQTLTSKLETVFGAHPYSFRAGRWGINGEQLRVLANLGYRVDSSVRPFYEENCFSYMNALTHPYWPDFTDVLTPDISQRSVLEIPVTSGFNKHKFEKMSEIHNKLSSAPLQKLHLVGLFWRLGLLRKTTVTPEGNSAEDICRCIDMSIKRGDKVINMFFHSSNLLPGNTPYVRSNRDKARFLDCIERCVEHSRKKHNAQFMTMRQIGNALTGEV